MMMDLEGAFLDNRRLQACLKDHFLVSKVILVGHGDGELQNKQDLRQEVINPTITLSISDPGSLAISWSASTSKRTCKHCQNQI